MNAPHAPILPASIIARRKVRAALMRVAEQATAWSVKPDSHWAELAFYDALRLTDGPLADPANEAYLELCHELWISEDGWPLNDAGDVIVDDGYNWPAERKYIPLKPVDPEYPGDLQGMDNSCPGVLS